MLQIFYLALLEVIIAEGAGYGVYDREPESYLGRGRRIIELVVDLGAGDDLDLVSVLKKNDALDPDGDFADSVLGVWNQNRDFYHTKTLECYTTFGGAYPIEWSDEDWAVLADAEDKGEVFILAFYVDDEGYWVEPLSCDGRGSHSIT